MHATLDQLLKLRDDPVADEAAASHVARCPGCAAQLARLRTVTRGLRTLEAPWEVPDRWYAIRSELRRPMTVVPTRARPGWLMPAASVAAVAALALALTLRQSGGPPDATPSVQLPTASGPVQIDPRALMAESRRLEELLNTLPREEPRITRASTALTVADLEDRIQLVDARLTMGAEEGLDRQQAGRLWRERVDLLNSLIAVRYAEASTTAF
jgi:hypothetical protein